MPALLSCESSCRARGSLPCSTSAGRSKSKGAASVFVYQACSYDYRRFAESIDYLNKALQLSPRNAHVLGAIGLSYHCTQDRERAIEYYHKALGCNAGDSFSGEMLQVALEEELGDGLAPAVDHDVSQPPSFDASSPFVLDSSAVAPALDTSDISRMSFG